MGPAGDCRRRPASAPRRSKRGAPDTRAAHVARWRFTTPDNAPDSARSSTTSPTASPKPGPTAGSAKSKDCTSAFKPLRRTCPARPSQHHPPKQTYRFRHATSDTDPTVLLHRSLQIAPTRSGVLLVRDSAQPAGPLLPGQGASGVASDDAAPPLLRASAAPPGSSAGRKALPAMTRSVRQPQLN